MLPLIDTTKIRQLYTIYATCKILSVSPQVDGGFRGWSRDYKHSAAVSVGR